MAPWKSMSAAIALSAIVALPAARLEGSDLAFSEIPSAALRNALDASTCAVRAGRVESDHLLAIIDYTRPSSEPRLWVVDPRHRVVLFEELVAHGRGSGDLIARAFSNRNGSNQTSLGLFRTAETYMGSNGYSLRLDGLERGINDRARERAIVMHGAPYVSDQFVSDGGRLGRSLGCPAVRPAVARQLIDRIKGGHLVFAFADDHRWLDTSAFLGGCAAATAAP